MFDRARIAKDFNKAAPHYAQYAQLQQRIGKELVGLAAPYLANAKTLLDVGAGDGVVTGYWPIPQKIALDMAEAMCKQAGIPAICAAAEELPVAETMLDVVASNLMMQWLTAPEDFFIEVNRVLRSGGIFAISTFSEGSLKALQQAFAMVSSHNHISPFMPHKKLHDMLVQSGFEVVYETTHMMNEVYDDVPSLLQSLKVIGAGNKLASRNKGLMTPRFLKRVIDAYPQAADHVKAEWNVSYFVAKKAD